MNAVVIVLLVIVGITETRKKPCRTWPSYGLCPYQPSPVHQKMAFNWTVDENCKDENNETRFIPCLFSAGFSCIMVFFDSDSVMAGCIRNNGDKLVTFEKSANDSNSVHILTYDDIVIHNPCSSREQNCSPSEVLYENKTQIYSTCCCKGNHCTTSDGYREDGDDSVSEEDIVPFDEPHQVYLLALCYGTTAAALTISASLTLYKAYTNRLILKNR